MKKLLILLATAAFVATASAHCGKCEGDKKEAHKCADACKDKCQAGKEGHKCADACKDKCAKKAEDKEKK